MLHELERHEPLISIQWDEPSVRLCIDTIVRDAINRYTPEALWPSHPQESFSPDARWNLYVGAAGSIWALNHLAGKAATIEQPDFSTVLTALIAPNRAWLYGEKAKNDPFATCGFLTGDTGILLVQACLGDPEELAEQIGSIVDANRDNPAREFMWGAPGTMLASLWLYDHTGKQIWVDRFRRDAAILWKRLEFFDAARCHLWTQNLYGHEALHIGAVHGFAGNSFPVLRGWRFLSPDEQSRWAERLAESLRRTALWKDDCANWPQSVGKHRPGRTAMLVQHCHGAPGIVTCFSPAHYGRARGFAMAPREMAMLSSSCLDGPETRFGWIAREHLRCTLLHNMYAMPKSMVSSDTPCGPAIWVWQSISGIASMRLTSFPHWIVSLTVFRLMPVYSRLLSFPPCAA